MRQYQDLFGLVSIYVGAVVGAGFATGQEINQFFVQFGYKGLVGIGVASIVLVLVGRHILGTAYRCQLTEYRTAIGVLLGPAATIWGDFVAGSFLFAGLAIMIAGGGEVLRIITIYPQWITSLIFGLIVVAGVSRGANGLFSLNKILVPLLMAVVLVLLFGRFLPEWGDKATLADPMVSTTIGLQKPTLLPNWLVAAVLYAAFNLGTVLTIFAALGKHIPDVWTAKKAGEFSGLVLGLLLILFWWGIVSTPGATENPIPMAYLSSQGPGLMRIPYLSLILLAMYTSAVADVFALVSRYPLVRGRPVIVSLIVVVLAWVIAQAGFVPLISTLYPAYGYLWTAMLTIMLSRWLAGRE